MTPFDVTYVDDDTPNEDFALCVTLLLPNRRLYHIPSADCWCSPEWKYTSDGDPYLMHCDVIH